MADPGPAVPQVAAECVFGFMRGYKRYVVTVLLAVGGLLALGACGVQSDTSSAVATPSEIPTDTAAVAPSPASEGTPTVKKSTVTVTRRIPYVTRRVKDSALAEGATRVRIPGRTGAKTLTYVVTLTDGVETDRKLVREVVTRRPVTRVIVVGTKQTRQCDPNYSGACVPIADDVDCAGGSGNGPAYVDGPVTVVGNDIYDLDRDGDGTACDT
jgi:hypothetical protein